MALIGNWAGEVTLFRKSVLVLIGFGAPAGSLMTSPQAATSSRRISWRNGDERQRRFWHFHSACGRVHPAEELI
jgi:hypothetical protein